MSRIAFGFAIVVAVVAVVGAIVWQAKYSREARVEAAYESCIRQFGGRHDAPKGSAASEPNGPATVTADSLGKSMQDLVKGVTAGMSGAVCGAVREACRADFEGAVCQNALAGFQN